MLATGDPVPPLRNRNPSPAKQRTSKCEKEHRAKSMPAEAFPGGPMAGCHLARPRLAWLPPPGHVVGSLTLTIFRSSLCTCIPVCFCDIFVHLCVHVSAWSSFNCRNNSWLHLFMKSRLSNITRNCNLVWFKFGLWIPLNYVIKGQENLCTSSFYRKNVIRVDSNRSGIILIG